MLWLWPRLAATAPFRPLVWEPPYAEGAAKKDKREKKKKKAETNSEISKPILWLQ